MNACRRGCVVFLLVCALTWAGEWYGAAKEPTRADLEFFEKRIRPILAEKCYPCHSAQAEKLKGGLLLDSKGGLEKGGESGMVVIPGEPDKSRLIQAIRYSDKDLQMPPRQMLSTDQIADFEQWVKMGAPDSRIKASTGVISTNHWAFKPLSRPSIPAVTDRSWSKSPIDDFVLAHLEKEKLKPAPPAQKRVLIRRAFFDLVGLSPTLDEVERFLADSEPEAFAKVVDRLLARPQFGEHWGRHWLDLARYADSNGLEFNNPFPNAWRYRDYVIRAFNQDKPFNEFVREQLAGDLLEAINDEDRYEKLTATGFLVLGPKVLGEPDRDKLVMDVVDEQLDVTTRAFLGLTVSCARCHDHKFDPIPTRDYYALAGIFKSTVTLNESAAGQQRFSPWLERPLAPPEMAAAVEKYDKERTSLENDLNSARQRKAALPGGIDSSKQEGILVDNLAAEVIGAWKESNYATNFVDKNYLHDGNEGKGKKRVRFRPNILKEGNYEVRVAYIPRDNRATNVPVTVVAAEEQKTVFLNQREIPAVNKIFASVGVFHFAAGTHGTVTISNEGTKGFVAVDAVHFVPITEHAGMMMRVGTNAPGATALKEEDLPTDQEIEAKLDTLDANAPPPVPVAMAVKDGSPQNCRINLRGDSSKLGDEVPRGFIKVAGNFEKPLPADQSGRLELADWIANERNPLTARVIANRIWGNLFGRGIVNTPDNFGALGDLPSDPELLDYLAMRFVEGGWSTKKLIREIMLSKVYQFGSDFDSNADGKDPDNMLIWRMSHRRLPVEAIRDAMLQVSGTLDLKGGGPSLETNGPMRGLSAAVSDLNFAGNNRRSVYLPILRNDLPDMFQAFDFSDPHTLNGRRHATTGATQALFMMNSPFVTNLSRTWAEHLLAHLEWQDSTRIDYAFRQAFCRSPSDTERKAALAYLERHENLIGRTEEDPEKRRHTTWQSFCQVLFASAEFRFLD